MCLTGLERNERCAPAELHWRRTSGAIVSERGRVSKIRARLSTRNDESYTVHAVGARESRMREQEVVHQNPRHRTRLHPLYTRYEPLVFLPV